MDRSFEIMCEHHNLDWAILDTAPVTCESERFVRLLTQRAKEHRANYDLVRMRKCYKAAHAFRAKARQVRIKHDNLWAKKDELSKEYSELERASEARYEQKQTENKETYGLVIALLIAGLMVLSVLLFTSCSETPVTPPDVYVSVRTTPNMPIQTIEGEWYGKPYTFKADTLYQWQDVGGYVAYPVEVRTDGVRLWLASAGKRHVFSGVMSANEIKGRMTVEYNNGRPGPEYPKTFTRVQK